eukprot:6468367-Amphidinium_carterae.1
MIINSNSLLLFVVFVRILCHALCLPLLEARHVVWANALITFPLGWQKSQFGSKRASFVVYKIGPGRKCRQSCSDAEFA